ncbi:retrovirus-related pol polyprotein from transposon TNT 1-94 [Tanacetum coccineum]
MLLNSIYNGPYVMKEVKIPIDSSIQLPLVRQTKLSEEADLSPKEKLQYEHQQETNKKTLTTLSLPEETLSSITHHQEAEPAKTKQPLDVLAEILQNMAFIGKQIQKSLFTSEGGMRLDKVDTGKEVMTIKSFRCGQSGHFAKDCTNGNVCNRRHFWEKMLLATKEEQGHVLTRRLIQFQKELEDDNSPSYDKDVDDALTDEVRYATDNEYVNDQDESLHDEATTISQVVRI